MAPGGGMAPGGNGGRAVKELVKVDQNKSNGTLRTERARWRAAKANGRWSKSRRPY